MMYMGKPIIQRLWLKVGPGSCKPCAVARFLQHIMANARDLLAPTAKVAPMPWGVGGVPPWRVQRGMRAVAKVGSDAFRQPILDAEPTHVDEDAEPYNDEDAEHTHVDEDAEPTHVDEDAEPYDDEDAEPYDDEDAEPTHDEDAEPTHDEDAEPNNEDAEPTDEDAEPCSDYNVYEDAEPDNEDAEPNNEVLAVKEEEASDEEQLSYHPPTPPPPTCFSVIVTTLARSIDEPEIYDNVISRISDRGCAMSMCLQGDELFVRMKTDKQLQRAVGRLNTTILGGTITLRPEHLHLN